MQYWTFELFNGRDGRYIGCSADAGRHDNMTRTDNALRPVFQLEPGIPNACVLVPAGAFERGAGPEVDLHGLYVEFQPVCDLVLGDVVGPAGRERQVRQVVAGRLVVQLRSEERRV